MEKTKECKKCKKQLPVKEFPTDNRAKDKLWRFCRACESARKKEQRIKNKANTPQTKAKTTKPKTAKGKGKKGSQKKQKK